MGAVVAEGEGSSAGDSKANEDVTVAIFAPEWGFLILRS